MFFEQNVQISISLILKESNIVYNNMAERKVLIKYFPKNFDHSRIVKRGRGKDKLMMVRNMLPMSLRCNTCANYLYIGTKFNMRMEICNEQTYLGIKVFRFYFKCTYCYGEITFKTDPKNHDYVVQTGGTRNYEAIKDAQQAEKYLKRLKVHEKEQNSMKYLQNKSYDSKREMELMEALEDIKNLNKRQGVIDPEDLLKNLIYEEEQQNEMDQEEEAEIDRKYEELRQIARQEREKQEQNLLIKNYQDDPEQYQTGLIKLQDKVESQQKFKKEQLPAQVIPKNLPKIENKFEEKPKVKSILGNMKKKIIKPNKGRQGEKVEI